MSVHTHYHCLSPTQRARLNNDSSVLDNPHTHINATIVVIAQGFNASAFFSG